MGPGVEFPSVTTEVTGGPILRSDNGKSNPEPSRKARKLLGWFRRESIEQPMQRRYIDEDDMELNKDPQTVGASHSATTANAGITIQYDVTRTVEELTREGSKESGDCVTCVDIPDHQKCDF